MALPAAPTPAAKPLLVHGADSPIAELARVSRRIARSDATVLLTGETGTGKEVFARLLHAASPRAERLLVPVNCGAIPEALLESELFGYVRGAFTGASSPRRGRIAAAEGGTLFLDEIGELPLSLQVKLLRVLQERSYEPVGSTEPVAADFRLVAATNRDLAAEVEAGRFRQDLYFRLLVCPIELPPLRERPGDVVPLFCHFWGKRGETRQVEASVFTALEGHRWPGNIRELENLVERLSVCAEGETVCLHDLPASLRGGAIEVTPREPPVLHADPIPPPAAESVMPLAPPVDDVPFAPEAEANAPCANQDREALEERTPALSLPTLPVNLPQLLREMEDRLIVAALAQSGGNKRAAADLLGLQRTTLVEKLRRRQVSPSAP
ncbi:sigma-54 interaction domain-containing protein [Vulgatibacter sp.]|uniref:sigma-54 interaction domain-containing protein n=1 Tax=Vulgatibacter sp. TaxID=1971226 RepID=UPI0035642C69